jgi:molybdopterin converting factor small subunit
MVRVTVLYFSTLRRSLGIDQESFELPPQTTSPDILSAIAMRHPLQAPEIRTARLAVDQAFAEGDVALREGAELAVITPVSGG